MATTDTTTDNSQLIQPPSAADHAEATATSALHSAARFGDGQNGQHPHGERTEGHDGPEHPEVAMSQTFAGANIGDARAAYASMTKGDTSKLPEFTVEPDHTIDKKENGSDTRINKQSVSIQEGDTNIQLQKQKDGSVQVDGPDGKQFHMQKGKDGEYSDGHGNSMAMKDGKLNLQLDGAHYEIDRHQIRHHLKEGGPDIVYHKDGEQTQPGQNKAGTIETVHQGDNQTAVKVHDDTGHMSVTAHQDGTTQVNVHDQSNPDQTNETLKVKAEHGHIHEMTITDKDGTTRTLTQKDGQWTGQQTDANGQSTQMTQEQINNLELNGQKLDVSKLSYGQALQLSETTTLNSDGTVKTTSGGHDVTVNSTDGASATVQQGDGKTTTVSAAGNTAQTQELNTNTGTTSTTNVTDGQMTHTVADANNPQQQPQQDFSLTQQPGGTMDAHMGTQTSGQGGVDFQLADNGSGGYQMQQAQLWNGDIANNDGSYMYSGGYIGADGSTWFDDGSSVTADDGMFDTNGSYLGDSDLDGDGIYGTAGTGSDAGLYGDPGVVAAVADDQDGMLSLSSAVGSIDYNSTEALAETDTALSDLNAALAQVADKHGAAADNFRGAINSQLGQVAAARSLAGDRVAQNKEETERNESQITTMASVA